METLPLTSPAPNSVFRLGGLSSGPGSYNNLGTGAAKTSNVSKLGASSKSKVAGLGASGPPLKPKQSKSRNGCITCKAKRLKCDETKPTCLQCQKRGVQCGGYKKDFKWRPFEEANILGKSSKAPRKNHGMQKEKKQASSSQLNSRLSPAIPPPFSTPGYFPDHLPYELSHDVCQLPQAAGGGSGLGGTPVYILPRKAPVELPAPPQTTSLDIEQEFSRSSPDPPFPTDCRQEGSNAGLFNSPVRIAPAPSELLHTANDVPIVSAPDCPPEDHVGDLSLAFSDANHSYSLLDAIPEDPEIEEIIRAPNRDHVAVTFPSPTSSVSAGTLRSRSSSQSSQGDRPDGLPDLQLFQRPSFDIRSTELLASYFNLHTCGIMSVKDGPSENPWRTLIWNLSKESPALHHALYSMTAFHMAKKRPALRLEGLDHARKSVRFLSQGISHMNIKQDAALATTLVLTFSEAFDNSIAMGIHHLKGARGLLADVFQGGLQRNSVEVQRLQFLYNVWVYLDVLASLTSDAPSEGEPLQFPHFYASPRPRDSLSNPVDPLLGCATDLFPIIGRVAALIQKVRRSPAPVGNYGVKRSDPHIVAQAQMLKKSLEDWRPEEVYQYEQLEDSYNDVQNCIHTAEAYRWATLLYLHQAVPEMPSLTSHQLAMNVMQLIDLVPQNSRSCVVHIYPLLAAGCEATAGPERSWVRSRWDSMTDRMGIKNVDKAYEVLLEVWKRRDAFEERRRRERGRHLSLSATSPVGHGLALHESRRRALSLSLPHPALADPPELDPSAYTHKRKFSLADYRRVDELFSYGLEEMLAEDEANLKRRAMADLFAARSPFAVAPLPAEDLAEEYPPPDGEVVEELMEEFTVKGDLHWVGVMKAKNWQVLLG